jgi:hypothetical protein
MIKIQSEILNVFRLNLLCEFSELRQNIEFSELAKKANTSKLNNKTIQESIIKKLKELGLYNDEKFYNTGFYYMKDKNLLDLTILKYNNNLYIDDYKVIFKVTDNRYNGENAVIFEKSLDSYIRYNNEKVDFKIDKIHEMGFYSSLESREFDFVLDNKNVIVKVGLQDIQQENSISKEISEAMMSKIDTLLPDYLVVKVKTIYFSKYCNEVYKYLEKRFEENDLFSMTIQNVNISNEHIYVDKVSIAEDFISEYMKNKIRNTILSSKEINNTLEELLLIEEFNDVRDRISKRKILGTLDILVNNDITAKKNYYFAKDILEENNHYLGKVSDLQGLEGSFKSLFIETFNIDNKVKDIYLISKYAVIYDLNKPYDALNSGEKRKFKVIENLMSIAKEFDINLHISSKRFNSISGVMSFKVNFSSIHARYLVVKKDDYHFYKLDGELDHFDIKENEDVIFKDLQAVRYNDNKNVNNLIIESVGA